MIPDPFTAITTHDGGESSSRGHGTDAFDLTVKVKRPTTKDHTHDWKQYAVTLTPTYPPRNGLAGAVVLWRCGRRGCSAMREVAYKFKRPPSNARANRDTLELAMVKGV